MRLQSIQPIQPTQHYKHYQENAKKSHSRTVLEHSLKELVELDSLAAARFGGPKLSLEAPRHKSASEYWLTVKNRKHKRPSTAPRRRRRRETKLMSAAEYTHMRRFRLKDAILGR
tara:strand:- start:94 stop:438 length:345 start_codon:yes stop_codon:yes gene_type:complete